MKEQKGKKISPNTPVPCVLPLSLFFFLLRWSNSTGGDVGDGPDVGCRTAGAVYVPKPEKEESQNSMK